MNKYRIVNAKNEKEKIKHKIKRWWLAYFVRDVFTINTGGNVMNDVLLLSNGQVLVIAGEVIALYKTIDDYNENNGNFELILRYKAK